jgi:hypothetical protein
MILPQNLFFPSPQGEDGMGGAGLGGSGFEFGVDPNEDPELALVSSQVPLHV